MNRFFLTFFALSVLMPNGQATAAFTVPGVLDVLGADGIEKPASSSVPATSRPILFREAANVEVNDLRVDHLGSSSVIAFPAISGNTVNPAILPGLVSGSVDSYMFHFDPVGQPFFQTYVTAITFASPVIGVQLFSSCLDLMNGQGAYEGALEDGDVIFGYSGAKPRDRGIEEDAFVLVIAGNTVLLAGSVAGSGIDQIRFLTQSLSTSGGVVPEPLSIGVWAGIACVAGLRRRG